MNKHFLKYCLLIITAFCYSNQLFAQETYIDNAIISYICNAKQQEVNMYWQDENGKVYSNIGKLLHQLGNDGEHIAMAMNGGMYLKDQSPQGLYIERGRTIKQTNTTKNAYGNFYMQPNGVFYILNNRQAGVCKTHEVKNLKNIIYATQSGPMLVHDGKINTHFNEGSKSIYIRNGVGILPDGKILFAISTEKVNLYRFANFFKQNGCNNALYLDGFVSRMYCPEKNIRQTDGNYGVIIAVFEKE